jgi:excinuclease ABC subunit B
VLLRRPIAVAKIQERYNQENNITPESIIKPVDMTMFRCGSGLRVGTRRHGRGTETYRSEKIAELIQKLEEEMRDAARKFEFERAAQLRDKARSLRTKLVSQ